MGSTKLKEDLSNCLINFDRRVLITELLDDYKVPYEEVNDVLLDYLKEQEETQKLKYEKRYIVHGLQEGDNKKEIFKVVEEQKLKEWLKKLQNAESSLYSVEVAGGAKSAAPIFKPMSVEEGVKLKQRAGIKATNGAASTTTTAAVEKKEIKPEPKKSVVENGISKSNKEAPQTSKKSSPKAENITKKSPKKEISPTETKKSKEKPAAAKKGIGNFFGPASTSKKSDDTKDKKTAAVAKPPTPKKMQDFFKKQAEKPKTTKESPKKPDANKSIQLFADEDEEPEEAASSDEEEKLEALKRDIISSDVEMGGGDEDDEETKPTTSKRRRILDSDDEEDDTPAIKHEKLDIKEPKEEVIDVEEATEPQQDETFLDEDGFVITKKPKQKPKSTNTKKTLKSPPVTMKASPKGTKKTSPSSTSKDSKSSANPGAKTKQAGIMNFFTKK